MKVAYWPGCVSRGFTPELHGSVAKFKPSVGMELSSSLPTIAKALLRRKVTPGGALRGHKIPREDLQSVKRIYETVEGQDDRYELNLYITGYDEDETGAETGPASAGTDGSGMSGAEAGQPGQSPEESPTR